MIAPGPRKADRKTVLEQYRALPVYRVSPERVRELDRIEAELRRAIKPIVLFRHED